MTHAPPPPGTPPAGSGPSSATGASPLSATHTASSEAAYASAAVEPPRRGPAALRVLFFLIGAPLLVLTLVLSAGFAVAAVAGLGAAVVIQHKRGRRYSLLSGWIGAVVGFALVSGAFTAYKVAGHSDTLTMAIDSARTQAATQPPPKLPGFLQRLQPNTTVDSATQARARAMTQSRGFVWFSLVFGGGIVLVIASTFAGTATWGFVTLLGYSFTGLWPPGTARPAEEVVDFG